MQVNAEGLSKNPNVRHVELLTLDLHVGGSRELPATDQSVGQVEGNILQSHDQFVMFRFTTTESE